MSDVQLTVGLPVWRAAGIAWLAMEGLCRQAPTEFSWELLVCEEPHDGMAGREFFDGFRQRLAAVGCARVLYISPDSHINLPRKWRMMGLAMAPSSRVFVLQAADDYSFPQRLNQSHRTVALEGAGWYHVSNGYFYSFTSRKTIRYNWDAPGKTHLNMALAAAAARTIPESDLQRNIDNFLMLHCRSTVPDFRMHLDTGNYVSVDTDGHNSLCVGSRGARENYYQRTRHPFYAVPEGIAGIGLPDDVVTMLQATKPRDGGNG